MELAKLTWPEVDRLDRDTPVVIPVAALEQHGHHLPVFTDSLLLGELMQRAQIQLADDVLFAPLIWIGNSDHHMDFPGTMSAPPRVWIDLISGMIENFVSHGFKRIVVANGHGGNDVPGRQSIFELRQKHRQRNDLLLLFATYWDLASPNEQIEGLVQQQMGHACEWETSMILALQPGWVKGHAAVEEVEFGNPFLPAHRAWTMPDRSKPGHVGDAAAASAQKGEQLFEVFTQGFVQLVRRVIAWDGKSWDG